MTMYARLGGFGPASLMNLRLLKSSQRQFMGSSLSGSLRQSASRPGPDGDRRGRGATVHVAPEFVAPAELAADHCDHQERPQHQGEPVDLDAAQQGRNRLASAALPNTNTRISRGSSGATRKMPIRR